MAATHDPKWPDASSLLILSERPDRHNVTLVGLSTHRHSLSPRSAVSTPRAIREALSHYSTWSYQDDVDLADVVCVLDRGDLEDPDAEDAPIRLRQLLGASSAPYIVLGGDNSATFLALQALFGDDLSDVGLVTLDAHHDLRDGVSNGSPVRQALEAGMDPTAVVQVGLADFSNSAPYARGAREMGIHVVSRAALRREDVESALSHAIDVAAGAHRRVYVDIDLDVADRSMVPGCPAAAPGGLSADELRRLARQVGSDERVVAVDLTEIDVARDSEDERTVRLAALLVLEVLAGVQRRTR